MNKGFTLVELSIVLVIIGLLIGGILAAQSMISTAKVTNIVSKSQQYEIAVMNFKTTYNQIPGDSDIFTPPGNNDGALPILSSGCFVGPNSKYFNYEPNHFWAHLVQAGMLKGNYVPFSPTTCNDFQNSNYRHISNMGINSPFTELTGKAQTGLATSKYPIEVYSGADGINVTMALEHIQAVAVSQKMESTISCWINPAQTGCHNPNARFGMVSYTIK